MILMGPLPGIIIGFFLMYFGDKNKNAELVSLAWIFLVWNLVNLIPLDALDGAHASSILFSKYNYQIQLVFTVLISIICVFFIVLFKNYFVLIIPIMLFFRIKSINSMNTIRMELESRGIDCRLGFYELNNKQYWILRKELIDLNKIPMDESMINEFTQSIYEKMIGQNMKAVLLDLPYDDLEKKGKYLATFIWFLLFILPVSILILLMYFYK